MVTNKDNMYWCHLPTYFHPFRGTQENQFSNAHDLIVSCCKYLMKDLPDQRLAPAAPPGLHSAQTRHGSALRELAQCEQLAPDHDPSVKTPNTYFLWVQTKLNEFRNSAVNFAKRKSNVLENITILFNAQIPKWTPALAHRWCLIYVGQMYGHHSCKCKGAFLFLISSEIYSSITLLIRIQQPSLSTCNFGELENQCSL